MLKIFSLTIILVLFSGCSSILLKPESEWTVEEFYQKAKGEFDSGQWSMAIEYYQKLKANFPYGEYAEQAYLELAYAYYKYDEPQSAIREMEEFIRIYPRHPQLAYAFYLKALASDSINNSWLDQYLTDPANRDAQSTMQAFRAYQDVVARFPDSPYAEISQQRLIIINNRLARRDLQIAEYYYKRGAYLAAVKRATEVIQNYPQSQSNIKALKLLKSAYEKMGMLENAESVNQVIQLNTAS
jgi:outer membrane protein assembly factor BamD